MSVNSYPVDGEAPVSLAAIARPDEPDAGQSDSGDAGRGLSYEEPLPEVAHVPDDRSRAGFQPPPAACPVSWDSLLRPARPKGLRGLAHRWSGGLVARESRGDRERRALLAAARTPVRGHYRVAVISIKGGVGKTTTTAALGAKLADLRGDRVVAVDANPHRGTLADRVGRTCQATVRDMLRAPERLTRYPDVQALTSQAPSRLEVLASEIDPAVASTFDDADYRTVAGVLERFYTLCLTDCGTGLTEPVVAGVLGLADALIVPAMASLDAANLAHATLDWLDAQGYAHLVRSAVVVICGVRGRGQVIDLDQLEDTLRHRVRDVVRIPFDPHLHSGAVTDLNELRPATDEAYLRLAATIADGFTPTGFTPPGCTPSET
jgi:MinD-like ATPase involved in chromosome partitioning or flagellar assembly